MDFVVRSAAPPALALFTLILFALQRDGDIIGGVMRLPPLGAVLWLALGVALGAGGNFSRLVAAALAPAYLTMVGFAAAAWPLAFVLSQDPIPTELVSLVGMLPNILVVVTAWALLYIYPPPSGQRAGAASRHSLPTGRLLLIAALCTMLLYSLTIGIIEQTQLGGPRNAPMSGLEGLATIIYGTSPIYFVLVSTFFWGLAMCIGLSYRVHAQRSTSDDVTFSSGYDSDRRFLATIVAVLPLLGFLGTILGISDAISGLEFTLSGSAADPGDLQQLLRDSLGGLSLAFETTVIGIAGSALLLLFASYIDKNVSLARTAASAGAPA